MYSGLNPRISPKVSQLTSKETVKCLRVVMKLWLIVKAHRITIHRVSILHRVWLRFDSCLKRVYFTTNVEAAISDGAL